MELRKGDLFLKRIELKVKFFGVHWSGTHKVYCWVTSSLTILGEEEC